MAPNVMLNLFQHLAASLLILLRGQMLNLRLSESGTKVA